MVPEFPARTAIQIAKNTIFWRLEDDGRPRGLGSKLFCCCSHVLTMPDVSSCISGVPTFTDVRLFDLEISMRHPGSVSLRPCTLEQETKQAAAKARIMVQLTLDQGPNDLLRLPWRERKSKRPTPYNFTRRTNLTEGNNLKLSTSIRS